MNETDKSDSPLGTRSVADIERAGELAKALRREIANSLVGQGEVIDQVLVGLIAGGHVLIEGVPGLGKTLLVQALARTFEGTFARIQFTPDLMPADVTGHVIYNPKSERFVVRSGPVFTNLLLADEINRAPAKTQSALLEVMQERQVTIEGKTLEVPSPFMTLATQNPIEQDGTYPLPEAQLDRFLLKISMDYPAHEEELSIVHAVTDGGVGQDLDVSGVHPIADAEQVLALQRASAGVLADARVTDYAVRITRATRDWQGITVGAGPRGAIAIVRAARATALLDGRDYTTPDDVRHVALPALRHRIVSSPELELEGRGPDDALGEILSRLDAPRQ